MNEKSELAPPIRVLVVDDSAFMRAALSQMIDSESGLKVVAIASCGPEALDKIPEVNPDVVTLDVQMPNIGGLETLRRVMSRYPRPVIMVSAVTEKDAEVTFDALSAGAFDYVPKQLSPASLDIVHIRSDLLMKIRAAGLSRRQRSADPGSKQPSQPDRPQRRMHIPSRADIIAIGTSTGGPKALQQILPRFPRDFSAPILIVQHMPDGFTASFARRLDALCAIAVREARDGEAVHPGTAYIAPAGSHMRVERNTPDSPANIMLDARPQGALHVPSADVLMTSVAQAFGNRAVGVILTGMGNDGAQGMSAIYEEGGFTIGQDESTCAVYGMPRSCAELGILTCQVPLPEIPELVMYATLVHKRA